MTRTLIVNCSLKTKSEELVAAVRKYSEVTLIADFSLIDENHRIGGDMDAVVISGSSARIVHPSERQLFRGVADLIRNCDLPLFGICYGHQLLCHTFGAKVGTLTKQVLDRFETVQVLQNDPLFDGLETSGIPFAENHFDYVLKEGLSQAEFILLADSVSCEVEAVRHVSKPFYGVQFHPERITVKDETHPEGHRILENFFKNTVKK